MLQSRKHKMLVHLKEYIIITFGLAIYAFGFTTMLINANTVPGGAGGISSLLYFGFGSADGVFSLGNIYFMVNVILLGFGLIFIGPKFGAKTIYAIVVISLMMNVFQRVIPPDFTGLSAEGGDQLLMVILGAVLCGFGVGTCFVQGGSTGGTDIIAMIVNKYRNISYGRVIMYCDIIIVSTSVLVFRGDLKPAIYGVVVIATVSYTIDMVLSGSRQSTQIMVFSPHNKAIGDKIISEANRGFTYLTGEGGFTGVPQKVISVVCRKTEQTNIYRIIKEIDPDAFIVSSTVSGAYGKGFEALRIKK